MIQLKKIKTIFFITCLAFLVISAQAQDLKKPKRYEWFEKYLEFDSYVDDGWVDPHWLENGNSFWFIDGPPENMRIYKVDPELNFKKNFVMSNGYEKPLQKSLEKSHPIKVFPLKTLFSWMAKRNSSSK
jgi:hypothetical protein